MRRALNFFFMPLHAQRWLVALGVSAAVHGALLIDQRPAAQQPVAAAAMMAILQTRTIAAKPAVVGSVVEATATSAGPPAAQPRLPPVRVASPISPLISPLTSSITSSTTSSVTVPAAAELKFLLRQSGQEGTARLSWQPQDRGGYHLSLTRELAGRALPTWRSEGETGAQGLAPSRYAEQRKGRDTSATNFRRDEGVISFSASAEQFALTPGVQDRLSWWLQLAGVIAAAPTRYLPGSELRLTVVGLRGEAREWVFEVLALEPVTLADGLSLSPPALHLRRAPLGMYDGSVELWLAPERSHLPVRILVGQPGERGWELLLLSAEPRD